MLQFLASAIAAIGASLNGMNAHHIEPTFCGARGNIEYCYYEGDPSSPRLIYYTHGFGDDRFAWTVNYTTGQIEDAWKRSKARRPHIVTISRKVWFYTDKSEGREMTLFTEWFERHRIEFQSERILFGESMGGHNALRWALDDPKHFQKVALVCPALPNAFVERLKTPPPRPQEGWAEWAGLAELLVHDFYRRSSSPNFNPLAETHFVQGALPASIYLAVTPHDQFGFYAGGFRLYENLQRLPHTDLQFEEQDVRHCNLDAERLATFLIR